jgi:electron transport complex protein RnfC
MPGGEASRGEYLECIRCSRCVTVCPMGLEPYLLMTLGVKQIFDRAENEKVMDCMECGSCAYTCPSNRPLLDFIRFGKAKVGQMIRTRKK